MNRQTKRDRAGVSPVIATILLVSITVVLAGVLFIWVTNILDTEKTETPFIGAQVQSVGNQTDGYYMIVINEVSGDIQLNDVRIQIIGDGGARKPVMDAPGDLNRNHTLEETGIYGNPFLVSLNGTDTAAGFRDAPPGDGLLNQDDIIYLKKTTAGGFGVETKDRIRLVMHSSNTILYDEAMEQA